MHCAEVQKVGNHDYRMTNAFSKAVLRNYLFPIFLVINISRRFNKVLKLQRQFYILVVLLEIRLVQTIVKTEDMT